MGVLKIPYFWTAFGIWSGFFTIFFALPVAFILPKSKDESNRLDGIA